MTSGNTEAALLLGGTENIGIRKGKLTAPLKRRPPNQTLKRTVSRFSAYFCVGINRRNTLKGIE